MGCRWMPHFLWIVDHINHGLYGTLPTAISSLLVARQVGHETVLPQDLRWCMRCCHTRQYNSGFTMDSGNLRLSVLVFLRGES
jgi:hypothetical protein